MGTSLNAYELNHENEVYELPKVLGQKCPK